MNSKQKISLFLNIIIVIFCIIGCILCFGGIRFVDVPLLDHGIRNLKFFTVQSNIFAGIMSAVYVFCLIKQKNTNKPIPTTVNVLKFIATIDLAITFLVVACFLGFLVEQGYWSLFVNANLLFHLFIPLIGFVSFVIYEDTPLFRFSFTFVGLIHIFLYSIFYYCVVLTHMQDGVVDLKYDWYAFAQLGLPMSFVFALILFGLAYLASFTIYKLNNKFAMTKKPNNTNPDIV